MKKCLIKKLEQGEKFTVALEKCGIPDVNVYWDDDKNALFIGLVAKEPGEEDFGFWVWWDKNGLAIQKTWSDKVEVFEPSRLSDLRNFIKEMNRDFKEIRDEAVKEE